MRVCGVCLKRFEVFGELLAAKFGATDEGQPIDRNFIESWEMYEIQS